MKNIISTLLLFLASPALAGAPIIFSGADAKLLKSNLDFFGQSKILSGTVDPSSVATSAPIGSIYLNSSSGSVYRKLDSGSSVNWASIGNSAVVTDWAAYTPTITSFGTATNISFRWRQIGTSIQIQGKFTSGTATGVEARISLPAGFTSASTIPTIQVAGSAVISVGGSGQNVPLIEASQTYMTLGIQASGQGGLTKDNGNNLLGSGQSYSLQAWIECAGLSGTVPTSYLPIAAKYTGSATSISGSLATVVWATNVQDTDSAMSSGVFTVPAGKGGNYQVNVNVQVTGTIALNSVIDMVLQKNNATVSEFQGYAGGAQTAQNAQISDVISLSAGDTVRVQLSSTATLPAITNSSKTWFSIVKVP